MTFTFVSNFINHHQMPFCEEMQQALGDDFCFVQTEPMSEARIADGWRISALPSYVREYQGKKAFCNDRILHGDITCFGWSALPKEVEQQRLQSGKVALRMSERIYREGQHRVVSPRGLKAKYDEHIRYRNAPVFLLCTGAYVASDFALIKSYPGKMYRWGYFPRTGTADLAELMAKKGDPAPLKLLWTGRMVALKHPEFAIRLLHKLTTEGIDAALTLCGDGPLRLSLEGEAEAAGIANKVRFTGTISPAEVRAEMERAHVFLFTSNYLEGWGAVLNEAMDAACAVVASTEAGATPFLIRDGHNGVTYDNGDFEAFAQAAGRVMRDPLLRQTTGEAAHRTIREEWNAHIAAERLLQFCEALLNEKELPHFDGGPLSEAPVLRAPSVARTREEKNILE